MSETAKTGRRWRGMILVVVLLVVGGALTWRSRLTATEWMLVGQWEAMPSQGRRLGTLELTSDRKLRWLRKSAPPIVGCWKVVGDRLIVEPPPRHQPVHQRLFEWLRRRADASPSSSRWPPMNLGITQLSADSFMMERDTSSPRIHWQRHSEADASLADTP